MNILLLSSTSDFFIKNLWWVIAAVILIGAGLYFLLSSLLSKKGKGNPKIASKSEYLEALGGEDNIINKSLERSRIVVQLKDYSKVNQEKLKEAGITGFIQMSDKLTLVIKDNADKAFDVIFGSND